MGRGLAPSPTHYRYRGESRGRGKEAAPPRTSDPRQGLRSPDLQAQPPPNARLPTCGDRSLDSSGRKPRSGDRRMLNFTRGRGLAEAPRSCRGSPNPAGSRDGERAQAEKGDTEGQEGSACKDGGRDRGNCGIGAGGGRRGPSYGEQAGCASRPWGATRPAPLTFLCFSL